MPGLDDEMSRDHDWGCRLTLLVDGPDQDAVPQITGLLERELPAADHRVAGTGAARISGDLFLGPAFPHR